jgi:flagellar hook protein FlgE
MLGSLYTSISGLRGHQTALDVSGNNISNVNSIGFKGGRVTFSETLVQTLRGATRPTAGRGGMSPMQLGLGMGVGSIDNILSQGVLQNTGVGTDLGINGDGFFILSDGDREYYSRVGSFSYDADGNMINPANGFILQGRLADAQGNISPAAPIDNLQLPFATKMAAQATESVYLGCNLDAAATDSVAELISTGTTGITSVSGYAANGAGGQHVITIVGDNATFSTRSGTNLTAPGALTGAETLASLGVTEFSDFTISVDGGTEIAITGLSDTSTVQDVVNAINDLVSGVTAEVVDGEVVLTRNYAGDGTIYNITTSVGAAGNISRQIFGAGAGSAFTVNSGTASTLEATNVFTPTGKAEMDPITLGLVYDSDTGLVTGIQDLGGGGIEIAAQTGLAAGTATIDTAATEHYTSILVYDSLGDSHNLSVRFSRSPNTNEWYWDASLGGQETIMGGQSGTLTFNPDGSLANFSYDSGATSLVFAPGSGGEEVHIDLNAGTAGGFDGITQFASSFSVTARSQDGYGMGDLTSVSIDTTGQITGLFSNGVSRPIAQIMLAKFNNSAGLQKVGEGFYVTSNNSGAAIKGVAGETVDASISAGALEMSNVDLAEEFVNLIVAQRGFQANARVLTASDDMLSEVVNIVR